MLRLSYDLRNQALGMVQAGVGQREVARRLSLLIRRHRQTGSINDRPKPFKVAH